MNATFLAHPFEYRLNDIIEFIDELRKEAELDGLECFHPLADEKQMDILVKYARKNNLYISGGSFKWKHVECVTVIQLKEKDEGTKLLFELLKKHWNWIIKNAIIREGKTKSWI